MQAAGPRGGFADLQQDLPTIGEKLPPRLRQADAAIGASKQSRPHLLFKDLNLLT